MNIFYELLARFMEWRIKSNQRLIEIVCKEAKRREEWEKNCYDAGWVE